MSPAKHFTPSAAIISAAICIVSVAITPPSYRLLYYSALLLPAYILWTKSLKPVGMSIKWTIPIALPLVLVHGILNPYFKVSYQYPFLPIRMEGIYYAVEISARMLIITLSIASCTLHSRMQLLSVFYNCKFIPRFLSVLIFQSISLVHYLSKRSDLIMLAQRSRGVAAGPGIIRKIYLLISIVIPLIAITIVESHTRATCLISRGFGVIPLNLRPNRGVTLVDLIMLISLLGSSIYLLYTGYTC